MQTDSSLRHRRTPRAPWAALLVAGLLAGLPLPAQEPGPPPAPADARVAGHWQGIFVIKPAVSELEMLFDFNPGDAGWKGTLSLPVRGVAGFPLKDVKVSGRDVSFAYSYSAGTSTFTGTLETDGDAISGTLVERGQPVKFKLTRQADRPALPPAKLGLVVSTADLKHQFNALSGKTRLVLLLSPTCGICKAAARIVERYVLDAIDSKDLAVIVLWEPALKEDSEAKAVAAAGLVPDPRAVHLWTPDPTLADTFGKAVGVKSSPAFDLYLLYPAHTNWEEGAPAPVRVMHAGDELPADRLFNGVKLAAEVREVLAHQP